jgi:uncharacterized membrane protein
MKEFNNNTIIFIILGVIAVISVVGIVALVFKYGAQLEVAILSQIPIAVVAALATAIKRKSNGENGHEEIIIHENKEDEIP